MKDMPNVGDEGEIWMKGPIIMKGVSRFDSLLYRLLFSALLTD